MVYVSPKPLISNLSKYYIKLAPLVNPSVWSSTTKYNTRFWE